MLKRILLSILFLLPQMGLWAQQDTLKVLFVGNSFTYFYNLPQVVSALTEESGLALMSRQSTVGGSNLEQHWKEERGTQTRQLIPSENWDYVVFNNHSMSAIADSSAFMEYGQKFAELVHEQGGQAIFIMTWAYDSNPLMQEPVARAYRKLATETQSICFPAGLLFAAARQLRPELNLFFDDKHPSELGTYMLGLAFCRFFTGQKVSGLPERVTTIDRNDEKLYLIFTHKKDARFLQQLVDEFPLPEREGM
jgi:hypothetical protein